MNSALTPSETIAQRNQGDQAHIMKIANHVNDQYKSSNE